MADLETLRAAFLYHFAQEVVVADMRLDKREVTVLTELDPLLADHGLMDADGTLTARYEPARDAALERLATELPEPQRRELLDRLLHFMAIDGDLDPKEWKVVHAAATALGLPPP